MRACTARLQSSSVWGDFCEKPPGELGTHRAHRLGKKRGWFVLLCSKKRWLLRCTARGRDVDPVHRAGRLAPKSLFPSSRYAASFSFFSQRSKMFSMVKVQSIHLRVAVFHIIECHILSSPTRPSYCNQLSTYWLLMNQHRGVIWMKLSFHLYYSYSSNKNTMLMKLIPSSFLPHSLYNPEHTSLHLHIEHRKWPKYCSICINPSNLTLCNCWII